MTDGPEASAPQEFDPGSMATASFTMNASRMDHARSADSSASFSASAWSLSVTTTVAQPPSSTSSQGCIGQGAMWTFHCADRAPRTYRDILASDTAKQGAIDRGLLAEGIFLIPGTRRFVCSAHTDEDFAATIAALDRVCARLSA